MMPIGVYRCLHCVIHYAGHSDSVWLFCSFIASTREIDSFLYTRRFCTYVTAFPAVFRCCFTMSFHDAVQRGLFTLPVYSCVVSFRLLSWSFTMWCMWRLVTCSRLLYSLSFPLHLFVWKFTTGHLHSSVSLWTCMDFLHSASFVCPSASLHLCFLGIECGIVALCALPHGGRKHLHSSDSLWTEYVVVAFCVFPASMYGVVTLFWFCVEEYDIIAFCMLDYAVWTYCFLWFCVVDYEIMAFWVLRYECLTWLRSLDSLGMSMISLHSEYFLYEGL